MSSSDYGPKLPPHLMKQKQERQEEDEEFGPSLPPQLKEQKQEECEDFGPSLPPHLIKKRQEEQEQSVGCGPESDSDEEDFVGPKPPKPGEEIKPDIRNDSR